MPLLLSHLVSIHAPAGGATNDCQFNVLLALFQSTRPRGARHFYSIIEDEYPVSIHAPAGGATLLVSARC